MEPFAETLLEPRNAGAAYAEQCRRLLQGGMSQSGQKDGLGGTQFLRVGGLGDHGPRLDNEIRIDSAGS